jgi:hypothetical protein
MAKPTRIILVALFLFMLSALPALAAEEEDRYFPLSKATKDTFSSYFLDIKTLYHMPADATLDYARNPELINKDKGYVQSWVKVEYVKSGAQEVTESLRAQGRNVAGYDNLAFSLQQLRVRPATNEVAMLAQYDYDKNGRLLGRSVYPKDRWVPFTVEKRIQEICESMLMAQKAAYAREGK